MFPIETSSPEDLPLSLVSEISRIVSSAPCRSAPVFIHLLGIPGAGKSSFVRILEQAMPQPRPVVVAFDRLMESMPEYKAEPDPAKAFSQFELPARAAGYLLLKSLIEKKADILLDHGGSRADHVEMLKYAKTVGYSIIVVRITAGRDAAKDRIQKRQAKGGRVTPLSYVDEREAVIEGLVPEYKSIADAYIEIPNESDSGNPAIYLKEHCDKIVKIYGSLVTKPKSSLIAASLRLS